jgi:outer membrane protein OmpA-like peptidoglycan-associated protein
MTMRNINLSFLVLLLAASGLLSAQESNPTSNQNPPQNQGPANQGAPDEMRDGVPVYKIQVVARDIPAINYFHRQGATKIGFQGTTLLPRAKGEAKVQGQAGRTTIDAEFEGLSPANGFGVEYLTYVLWAITPEGRPVNLGEVLPTGSKDRNHIAVTANLQAFGLIITAEPYYAVTMPSDLVVMQNVVLEDKTEGVLEHINAHYTLLPRGAYQETAGRHSVLNPIRRDERSPLELYEAVNAVQIAEAAGAGTYAADTMVTAKTALQNAQDLDTKKSNRKQTITFAREAVQSAEDARIITIRKIKAEDEAAERKAREDAEQSARLSKQDAEQQAAQRAQAEAAAQKAQGEQREAEQRALLAKQQADLAKQQADQANQQALLANQQAQQATQQAEQVRERLKQQLSQVLQTTETARGLIMNMSDVLFDFNKYTLKPEAREKLARVSGILLAYPDLKVQVEGYTDNIGSDEYNQKLSERRADSVQQYLITASVPDKNVAAAGYGKSDPIADNSTNAGRAQNRRVQLVVSGASIGVQESAPGGQSEIVPPASEQPRQQAAPPDSTGQANPPQ